MKVTDLDQYNGNTVMDKAKGVAQSTLATVQGGMDLMQAGLARTQDTVQTGLSTAQDTWQGNVKRASKSLKKAQKKMKRSLASMQDSMQSGLEQTQDVLQSGLSKAQGVLSVGSKNVKRAGKGLQKATGSLKEAQGNVQSQLARYARKRKRAKVLFRIGLLTGVVLILLYAPWPGSDTRRQLGVWWKQVFPPTQG